MSLSDRLSELLRPEAFPHAAANIRLLETHISWVILAGGYAYKIRKPIDLGFADFSTLDKRQADCTAEILLNRRLCPDVYLGIVHVVDSRRGLRFSRSRDAGEPAVLMRRLPDTGMLPSVVERGDADNRLMDRIARRLARFHAQAATGPAINALGTLDAIRANWDENFDETRTFGEDLLPRLTRSAVSEYVRSFVSVNQELFDRRVGGGRIRDGHGDLHAGSICVAPRRLYLFDCIEFNDRFRCADVAAEVAFLAMDLDHLGRADLGWAFVDAYVRHSGDQELLRLLDFYKCYRAFIRGKVLGMRLLQSDTVVTEASHLLAQARAYFDLASTYARPLAAPLLLVIMGLPATGKTTLARTVAARLGLVHVSSDVTRKRLARIPGTTHRPVAFGRGLYTAAMTRRTYAALRLRAARYLRQNRSVVLDATFGRPSERQALDVLARKTRARLLVVKCQADEHLIMERLAERGTGRIVTMSDARGALWPALRSAFVEPLERSGVVTVDTSQPLQVGVEAVLAAVRADGREDALATPERRRASA